MVKTESVAVIVSAISPLAHLPTLRPSRAPGHDGVEMSRESAAEAPEWVIRKATDGKIELHTTTHGTYIHAVADIDFARHPKPFLTAVVMPCIIFMVLSYSGF